MMSLLEISNFNLGPERALTFMSDSLIQIGSADNPWPCDGKVEIELTGSKWSTEIGAPDAAVTIGAKVQGLKF